MGESTLNLLSKSLKKFFSTLTPPSPLNAGSLPDIGFSMAKLPKMNEKKLTLLETRLSVLDLESCFSGYNYLSAIRKIARSQNFDLWPFSAFLDPFIAKIG